MKICLREIPLMVHKAVLWHQPDSITVKDTESQISLVREKQKAAKFSPLTQLWVTLLWNLKPRRNEACHVVFSKLTLVSPDSQIPPDSAGTWSITFNKERNLLFTDSYCFVWIGYLSTLTASAVLVLTHLKWPFELILDTTYQKSFFFFNPGNDL